MKSVCIDAGHGGSDPGAVGNNLVEKNINLSVALKVAELLIHNQIRVIMTRNIDKTMSLIDRAKIANNAKVDIFVSVHHNANNGKTKGYEVIHSIRSKEDDGLAVCIANEFKALGQVADPLGIYTRASSKGKDIDYYGVLRDTTMPAVITEYCFLDSIDFTKIDTVIEHMNEAYAIAKGICKYLQVEFKDPAQVKPVVPVAKEHWAEKYFQLLSNYGIIISEKNFDETVTHGELMAMMCKLIEAIDKKR